MYLNGNVWLLTGVMSCGEGEGEGQKYMADRICVTVLPSFERRGRQRQGQRLLALPKCCAQGIGRGCEQSTSEEKVGEDESENGNDIDDDQNDAEDEGDEEAEGEDEGDDEEGEEEQEGRRRYDHRNRAGVRRLSMDESKKRSRSPRRVLRQGLGTKVSRDVRKGGSRVHKRHRLTRTEDSDDSILVDELDQGPAIPWGRGGSRSGPPSLFGGLDMHGTTAWGLHVAASGWGNQSDAFAASGMTSQ
ncbi:hypothetical protein F3Y22_tig00110258pilonHSYRG00144 [Hibiscus syriacus]|uniref:Uncharacterized protein n=1 Tax=Hibiscus syriacus TaxID=106335 RepID=A0A6A3BBY8_HIBSY|nr:hypothetical protein F3Y22_tig00110258pilonHSYRG00144 [Hibiscus syriacus]